MKFVCSERHFNVLDDAAIALGMEVPGTMTFVDLTDDRLIGIARLLGMEELTSPAPENEDVMQRLRQKLLSGEIKYVDLPRRYGKSQANDLVKRIVTQEYDTLSAPENVAKDDLPACVICGKPCRTRKDVCSEECLHIKNDIEKSGVVFAIDAPITNVRICEICGSEIIGKKKGAKVCSKTCAAERQRRYVRAGKLRKLQALGSEPIDPFDDSLVSPEPVSIGRDLDESEEAGVVTERHLATASNPA